MRTFTDAERALIIRMHLDGICPSVIAAIVNMPHSVVPTVLTKWKISGCMTMQSGSHQPCKLSD